MPHQSEKSASVDLFLPEFIHRFLPDRKSLEPILDSRFFSRERRLSLEVTLALVFNLVRPGERVGYQKVIDRFFSVKKNIELLRSKPLFDWPVLFSPEMDG